MASFLPHCHPPAAYTPVFSCLADGSRAFPRTSMPQRLTALTPCLHRRRAEHAPLLTGTRVLQVCHLRSSPFSSTPFFATFLPPYPPTAFKQDLVLLRILPIIPSRFPRPYLLPAPSPSVSKGSSAFPTQSRRMRLLATCRCFGTPIQYPTLVRCVQAQLEPIRGPPTYRAPAGGTPMSATSLRFSKDD